MILDSELILNADGSIFHLHLRPGQVADTVILVGDPKRVDVIESLFSDIEFKIANREYVSMTGKFKDKRITVVSTGVGIGNIDIVMNELDALVNIDFETREIKSKKRKLEFIRIGTSGSLQKHIPVNSYVISEKSVGFDNLLYFYEKGAEVVNEEFRRLLRILVGGHSIFLNPYVVDASENLLAQLKSAETFTGITITAPGFYVPQGRELRLSKKLDGINNKLSLFEYHGYQITNYEMESSALYGLSKMLGHDAIAICLIIANRLNKKANKNYRKNVKELITYVLHKITADES
ncbi:nucleoside phosphorylase [Flagellimonas flava]|uniref:Uridine phosphorylase n=1 Tax=Flagellimonas flava TaxID=570519 RepID=A0A1M5IE23_9FLAO|nr:nucleoside phosphorylase [Allomuricauda flava]SHG26150.1 uridine phosphorylase [Allomuricauda flava]